LTNCRHIVFQLVLCTAVSLSWAQTNLQSKDGYVRSEGNAWILGTSLVEKRVRLSNGRFAQISLRNKVSGREYQDGNNPPDEIRFLVNGHDIVASNWRWAFRSEHASQFAQGELQLDVELSSAGLRVSKHYVVYPGTAVI
jgi:hypothetical protein